ncbi:MAG: hypothetical protein H0W64_07650 [Gammaproteobacteria bacterium]|nr:hypothetical protein [Gammaproteobacteria bacterium]
MLHQSQSLVKVAKFYHLYQNPQEYANALLEKITFIPHHGPLFSDEIK